ncbi:Retrovirus-related Pol polyprotein from transposon TNT 1-94 [Vitis vinifera]|uniref:Retrovirus-related Pol polyprotein from transposon TNT 1-94 n=1 Tax=Vitis vinifera TaxID=29760 RepID=A0A438KDG5_VITVI|nr:Retrovirus-related Pol polyprotein from transposon TNT 1-94 [Vitis vinifera]
MGNSSQQPRQVILPIRRGSIPIASIVGSLMFAMICTRPDIAQAVGAVSQFIANPRREHCNIVKRILGYIKGTTNATLCFGESKFIVNAILIQTLQVILIRENLLWTMCSHLQEEL